MQPTVTAIVVARNGSRTLERTLAALAAQTRRADRVLAVDAGSTDGSAELLAAAAPAALVTTSRQSFGEAIAYALHTAALPPAPDEWLWLLAHDNAPDPGALEALLGTVEVSPSVAVAGPKVMRADAPDTIARFGETMSPRGRSIVLVEDELDQAQHDTMSDVLAVSEAGMLVRRDVWTELGGFDPRLPSIDAALDFCVRVRLAGYRVVAVPGARVTSAGGPELFGRRSAGPALRDRIARAAQLHRRFVYAPAWALPFHWISLVPLAIVRSIGHLLAKRPGSIAGELATAFGTAFGASGIGPARRTLARRRRLGWATIAPLRMSGSDERALRSGRRELLTPVEAEVAARPRPEFLGSGGVWVVLLALLVGVVVSWPLLGAQAAVGGGLLPLSPHVAELWQHVGYGSRTSGIGQTGAADPFAALLAILGSLAFWQPSLAIVVLYVVALPLAALAAWFCAARLSERGWVPAVAALLWAFAPPLVSALDDGRLGAVVAHLALPWLVLAAIGAVRSGAAAGAASLLFALVVVSAPSLAPALVLAWIAWMCARPRAIGRLLPMPLPALVLAAPLAIDQVLRGTPLALLADPGRTAGFEAARPEQLALASPQAGMLGWDAIVAALGLPSIAAGGIVALLLVPLVVLALVGLFLPGSSRAVASIGLALLGLATAVASAQVSVAFADGEAVPLWPGAGLSLFWLGLVGAALVPLAALRRGVVAPALVTVLASAGLVAPLLLAPLAGTSGVRPSTGRTLPAYVTAQAQKDPDVGTLVVSARSAGSIVARVERGTGTTLDEESTLVATRLSPTARERDLATLAGNLVSESGLDPRDLLARLGIDYVLLDTTGGTEEAARRQSMAEALDSDPAFVAVGQTDTGRLWRFTGEHAAHAPGGAGDNTATPYEVVVLVVQGIVVLAALLLAIPTRRRPRSRSTAGTIDDPETIFGEEDDV